MNRTNYTRNLIIKIVINALVVWLFLPTIGMVAAADRWVIALVTAVVLYLVGDLVVLPRWGPTTTAIADVFIAMVSIVMVSAVLATSTVTTSGALIIGVLVGITEWFFHMFLKQTPAPKQGERT